MNTHDNLLDLNFSYTNSVHRIVSLVPSQTELLVDLGLEKHIVGITKFCIHPINLRKKKAIVGGTKNIHIDKIKALKPSIILCNKEENTKEIVAFCKQIAPTHVSDIFTIKDSLALVQLYGNLFSCQVKAKAMIQEIKILKADFENFIATKKTIKVAYFIWKNPWMVAANNTFINHLLNLNKFENVYQDLNRYPEINLTNLANKNLDVIFLSSEPYPFKEEHLHLLKEKTATNCILVDGEYFSWYGSRLLKAFAYFKQLRTKI